MRFFKCFLVLSFIALISFAAVVISMRGTIVRYGVVKYFANKGLMIDVGPVSIDSLDHVSVEYLRLQKQTDSRKFVLEFRDMSVWGSPIDFLLKGSVDRITFKNPYVNWGKLTPKLHNPFRGTFMQTSPLIKKPEGIVFNHTFGVLSLKALADQQIRFDLFPEGQNLEYGTISGRFFEDDQHIHGYFDLQSADVQYHDVLFDVDLNRTGHFTGGFHLSWSPGTVSLGLNPFTVKTKKVMTMGDLSFEQNEHDEDCLKGEALIAFGENKINATVNNTTEILDIILRSKPKKTESAPLMADIKFKKHEDYSQMILDVRGRLQALIKAKMMTDQLAGDISVVHPNGQSLQGKVNMTKENQTIRLCFKQLFWENRAIPELNFAFEIVNGQCVLKEGVWGDKYLDVQGLFTLNASPSMEFEVGFNRFDLSLLIPFLGDTFLQQVSAVVSGTGSIEGSLLDPRFEVDLTFNEGYFKKLKFRSGELHAKGTLNRIMIDASRFVRDKDMIFYEGELILENGLIENKISYKTDGKSLQWAGWALKSEEDEFSMERKINDQVMVKFRNLSGFHDRESLGYNEARLELEYDMETSSHDLLFMTIKDDEEIMGVKRKYEF